MQSVRHHVRTDVIPHRAAVAAQLTVQQAHKCVGMCRCTTYSCSVIDQFALSGHLSTHSHVPV